MTSDEQDPSPNPDDSSQERPEPINQQIQHSAVSARVPAGIGRGVFSTGAVVFNGQTEFITDFLMRLGSPHGVVARVVLSPQVFGGFVNALRENLGNFNDQFGAPAKLPQPPPGQPQPSITDLYDELKLPEELYSGVYANAVLIGHSASEFWFDFITNFFPHASVSCRVCMSAQQIPGLLDSMNSAFQAFQRGMEGGGQPPA